MNGLTKYITLYCVERACRASLASHNTFQRRAAVSGDVPHIHRHCWIPTEAAKQPRPANPNSTFFADGYQDAKAGRDPSPPYHPETTVYAAEYMAGFHRFSHDA